MAWWSVILIGCVFIAEPFGTINQSPTLRFMFIQVICPGGRGSVRTNAFS